MYFAPALQQAFERQFLNLFNQGPTIRTKSAVSEIGVPHLHKIFPYGSSPLYFIGKLYYDSPKGSVRIDWFPSSPVYHINKHNDGGNP